MILTDTQYNDKGQVYMVSDPYFAGGSPVWAQTYAAYDASRTPDHHQPQYRTKHHLFVQQFHGTRNNSGENFLKTYGPDGTLSSASDNGGTILLCLFPRWKAKDNYRSRGAIQPRCNTPDAARNQTQLVLPQRRDNGLEPITPADQHWKPMDAPADLLGSIARTVEITTAGAP